MKRVAAVIIAGLLAIFLSACGSNDPADSVPTLHSTLVTLPDGQKVACVVYASAGLTCDWGSVR